MFKNHNPYIVGDWIKQDNDFYGRQEIIDKYLDLGKQFYWLVGARRMGKTSLLHYIHRHMQNRPNIISLFWDVSGTQSVLDLKLSFLDCLEASETELTNQNIKFNLTKLDNESLLNLLRWLIREAKNKQLLILLLVDEAEALLNLGTHNPQFINRLKAFFVNQSILHIIIATNHGFASYDALDLSHKNASFLQPFVPPDYLTAWTIEETRCFLKQCTNNSDEIKIILKYCGGLPFLTQMICFYLHEHGSIEKAIETIRQNQILDLFFRNDVQFFDRYDILLIAEILKNEPVDIFSLQAFKQLHDAQLKKHLYTLTMLGFLEKNYGEQYNINNEFFREWLQQNHRFIELVKNIEDDDNNLTRQKTRLEITIEQNFLKMTVYENNNIIAEQDSIKPLPLFDYSHIDFYDFYSIKNMGIQFFNGLFQEAQFKELYIAHSIKNNLELIFIIKDKKLETLPFEFLHNGKNFLALQHPTTRSNNSSLQKKELLPQKLQVLLIASNTPPDISYVDNEIILLKDQFFKISREHELEIDITTISSAEADYTTIKNILNTGQHQIIHYAGHCGINRVTQESQIFCLQNIGKSNRTIAIPVQEISCYLQDNVVLFYFNACNSAKAHNSDRVNSFAGFSEPILDSGTKYFIGHTSDIEDRSTAEFALNFYWNLFNYELDFVKALQQTRLQWEEKTRFQKAGHLTWLSPVLMQKI